MEQKITYNPDEKYDIQLSAALIHEQQLGTIFTTGKIELKTEQFLWEKTGNIAIEYRCNGKASGIAVTQCERWIHELRCDGEPIVGLMVPIKRLKELGRRAWRQGRFRRGVGDNGRSDIVLIPIRWVCRR